MAEDYHYNQRLYEQFFEDVYQYLLYFTNSSQEAEDLTQETFIRVFKGYSSFQNQSSEKTWIFSIAKRVAIDHYRKNKWMQLVPDFIFNLSKSKIGNPEEEAVFQAEWQLVQEALLQLKPDYRNVVILRGLKECSVKETAEILGWKESKVKVDYHRAIHLLKKYVNKYEGEGVGYENA